MFSAPRPEYAPARIVKLSQREHILHRPGMYIGSVETDVLSEWAPNADRSRLSRADLTVNMGLYKIFDEIVVNASDHAVRTALRPDAVQVRQIRVDLCAVGERGELVVQNDGEGLDTSLQPEHGLHGPELLFGNLLCSTNYEDAAGERVTGGLNGIGSKATNVMSMRFEVDTVDAARKKRYVQEWRDNMSVVGAPKITACSKKPYTRVAFLPDYARFGMPDGLTQDMRDLFVKRVMDLCAVTPSDVAVFLDGVKLPHKDLESYASLYLGAKGRGADSVPRAYARINPRWEVVASVSDDGFSQVSFVNGVWTAKGGRHVDAVAATVCRKVAEAANKRRGQKATIKPNFVKDNLFLIVKATVPDAAFDSQTKDCLTTPPGRFGCRVDPDDAFIERLCKTGILERCDQLAAAADGKKVAKTDGSKKSRVSVPQLDDANLAGTARSAQCTLILCEGMSAKTMAVAGLSEVGRDLYGIFPLRGKLLNVRDSAAAKIAANAEITAIKKILGLEAGKAYADVGDLRYGKILIMTDADVDGSHIKALVLNAFASMWPSLYKLDGFITTMMTPIVKASKGRETREFYNLTDYKAFEADTDGARGWTVKHFKGLGTSSAAEAKGYFRDLRMLRFVHDGDSDEKLSLAFDKKRADDRKAWLEAYDPHDVLEAAPQNGGGAGAPLTHGEFVDRELIHFSDYDLQRSIPSAIDGLKPSQRKILCACINRKLTSGELRVAQLAGYVSESMQYHHGEVSLQGAIVGMAQDFVGSNNVNLLMPLGQHGSRLCGGSDAASARYIYTRLSKAATLLYRAEDAPVLEHLEDEGARIEPRYFVPVVPVVLLNGTVGIGTGFSTSVPMYEPRAVVANVRRIVAGEVPEPMTPWFRGFKGEVICVEGRWWSLGKFARKSAACGEVTELPIGTWTETYKDFLETQVGGLPNSYENQSSDVAVRFVLRFADGPTLDGLLGATEPATGLVKLMGALKLASNKGLSTTNMHLYGPKGAIRKYPDVQSVLMEHHAVRLATYAARKARMDADLEAQLVLLGGKARFVREVIAGDIPLLGIKGADLDALLAEREYASIDGGYGYLTRLHVSTLTAERASAMEKEAQDKELELRALRATTEQSMWLDELDELDAELARG